MRAFRFGMTLLGLSLALPLTLVVPSGMANAQKAGGTLRIQLGDTPPSPSLLEEITVSAAVPFMGVFNNLVIYDQSVARNTFESIRPELATAWTVGPDGRQVNFSLRPGVKWHDGKAFTAADMRCTFDLLMEKGEVKLRRNPRGIWFENVEQVTADNDSQVPSISSSRNRPCWRSSPQVGRPSIPAMCRRRRCDGIRSAPGPSSSSS
jgi:ABC-type transport system substrate-binding protein